MLKVGATTMDCVAAVSYRYLHQGKPGTKLCYLTLVGKKNPSDKEEGWPSEFFRLMWSDDRAAH